MVYALFFYDMAMTLANIVLCATFALLYVYRRNQLHLWLAILFGLSMLDIILMYLLDFIPDFQLAFSGAVAAIPFVYTYLHMGILFVFRMIAGIAFDRKPRANEGAVWVICLCYVAVSCFFPDEAVHVFAAGLCMGLVQLYVGYLGIVGIREGRADASVLGRKRTTVLVTLFAVCSLGFLIYTIGSFVVGATGPRNPFVEVSGGINLVFGCIYLVAYERRRHESTAAAAVPGIVEKYDLTRREGELLPLLMEGMTNQQIASQAYISVGTVKTHAHNIYAKLGIRGRSELEPFIKQEMAVSARTASLPKEDRTFTRD